MLKKIALVVCACITGSMLTNIAYAEKEAYKEEVYQGGFGVICNELSNIDSGFGTVSKSFASAAGTDYADELYSSIEEGLRNHQKQINIRSLNIPIADHNTKVMDVFSKVLFENPDLMVYASYSVSGYGNYLYSLTPNYMFDDLEEEEAAIEVVDAGIQYYVDIANELPEDDILGRVLVVHDEFVKQNEYATDEYLAEVMQAHPDMETDESFIRTPYCLFKYHTAVCQGNAIALAAIYNRLGIETTFCSSEEINHIWNCLKIDGTWYHLDETWNDPVRMNTRRETVHTITARHNFLLTSTDGLSGHGTGDDWFYYIDDVECNSDKYESGYIFNGGYYGVTTFENGRYKVDAEGFHMPFYSQSTKSPGAIATDFYPYESQNAISFLSNGDRNIDVRYLYARYNDEYQTNVSINTDTLFEDSNIDGFILPRNMQAGKMFFWRTGICEPFSEPREIEN